MTTCNARENITNTLKCIAEENRNYQKEKNQKRKHEQIGAWVFIHKQAQK